MELTARNTDLQALHTILTEQHAAKVDLVLPATDLTAKTDGTIHVTAVDMNEDGVTDVTGDYKPTDIAVGHLASRLGVDTRYLRKCYAIRPDIAADNINGWIQGRKAPKLGPLDVDMYDVEPDPRKFLFRGFRSEDGVGTMRGLLSDSYGLIDNIDVLMAALDGIRDAGVQVEIDGCDLSERNMRVRVVAPEIQAMAPALFENYRSPFGLNNGTDLRAVEVRVGTGGGWTPERAREVAAREGMGYAPGQEPILFGGFVISNSELGDGAFSLTPRAVARICRNGLTITADAERAIHLGAKMEAGRIDWSADTRRKALALIKAKTRDAARTFVSAEYWQAKVAELEGKAGKPVTDPDKTIKVVGKALGYGEAEQQNILRHFILGGQATAGGLMNAVTSAAQVTASPDTAADMEATAVRVLDFV